MKTLARLLPLFVALSCAAQHLVEPKTFDAIATEYSGESAQENTRRIVEYHRIQGSPMMAAVATEVVLPRLKAYGLEAGIEQFPSDGKIKYGTYTSPMGWDMRSGELWIENVAGAEGFKPTLLCRYADVPMCVSTYSKGGEWAGELVDVGSGTSDADYQGVDVSGKVALASGYAANVVREAVLKHGAVGVVIYPSAADRPDHPDMVRYNGIWPSAEELDKTSGGFQISRNQYEMLKALMRSGAVRVHGKIDATLGPGKLTLVHAYIRGTEHPEREVLITGHLDHPKWSANDNASGSGAMMEAARTLETLIAAKKIPGPRITIHFMWVPEYFGTLAYVANHPELRSCGAIGIWNDSRGKDPCIVANINMDMVGEDTVKTNSRFYFTRAPDSVPSSLETLLSDALEQTREADLYAPTGTRNFWPTEIIPYTQGSDHDVFLGLHIPATMLGHDPDWTHHTSEDKLDKTDASEFRRVGVFASAAAFWMSAADGKQWDRLYAAAHASRARELARRLETDTAVARFGYVSPRLTNNAACLIAESKWLNFAMLENSISINQSVQKQMIGEAVCPLEPPAKFDASAFLYPPHLNAPGKQTFPEPHRNVLLPLDATVFVDVTPEDAKWLSEQESRFASDSEGLPTKPNFALISFEALNFMDGHRNTAQIADLLSAEYLLDIDQAWVDRLVSILAKRKLVATPK
ncbi:MAG TPA: DUF4910 domain-containing protein [Candidatus Angelobacter sp.]|nr:DUF4910 domain-containing protein [Candidatus Angelobacter sp.]